MTPKLILEQQITPFVNKYLVYEALADGTKGQLLAHAQQKRLTFKEKVTFYTDEQHTTVAFTFRAEKVLDVHGRFLVEGPDGMLIGAFKKQFAASLLNSTWNILDQADQPKISVSEKNEVLAVVRRFGEQLPFFNLILPFLRYNFIFRNLATGQEVGSYEKTTLFRDHYILRFADDAYAAEDWRVLAAMSVALDALQSR